MKIKRWITMFIITALLGASAVTVYAEDSNTCENGKHTPDFEGECLEPTYIECSGGYKAGRYSCMYCDAVVFATGEEAYYTEGTGIHAPDLDNLIEADYAPCVGGFKEDYYECMNLDCGARVNAQGLKVEYYGANAPHTLEYVAKLEPTVEKEGCKEHWKCVACNTLFADSEGNEMTYDFEVVIAKLDKVEETVDNNSDRAEVTVPKTGNPANLVGYFTAMAAALAVMVGVLLKRKNV